MPAVPGPSDPAFPPALTTLGYDARWATLLTDFPAAAALRVLRDDRGAVLAAGADGEHRLATPFDLQPVAGDWIAVRDGMIEAILERSSAVSRPRPNGSPQVQAANTDRVGSVHPLGQPLKRRRLERGLVLAWESGAAPLIVLTKADLCDDLDTAVAEAARSGPGVDVVAVSAVDLRGLPQLRTLLQPCRTLVLLGASGAGKSSLINALAGQDLLATTAVRDGDAKGRHTTTRRQLVVLPDGGLLLDTPGLRALTVGAADEGIDLAFPEIEQLADQCRFGDCSHDQEPGCAVLAAVDEGSLRPDRYEGWRRIQREVSSAALRADPIALRQHSRQWGRMTREATRIKRGRDPQ